MKKIILCVFMFMAIAIPAYAGNTSVEVSPACENAEGQVLVDVVISENAVQAGSFSLTYDSEVLNAVNIIKGEAIKNCTSLTNVNYKENAVRINWFTGSKAMGTGNICTVVFDVISDEKAVTPIEFGAYEFLDYDVNNVDCDLISGKAYINGMFFETEFSRNGEIITDGLGNLPIDMKANIFNATGEDKESELYIAKYKPDNSLLGVEKIPCSTVAGDITLTEKNIGTGSDVSYIKVFCWEKGTLKPVSEPGYIGN